MFSQTSSYRRIVHNKQFGQVERIAYLELLQFDQSALLYQTGSSFPFGKLRCRFSKPEREGTSRTGSRILINQIWKLHMDFEILNLIVMDA